MKTLLWIVVGAVIAVVSWVPLNIAGRYDIPFGQAILAIFGSLLGGLIIIIAAVGWVRRASTDRAG